jgi:2-polyprenyl-3-methyl-5-hydroxy-6-metoxy-1,4-benzoquinol methylase
LFYNSGVPNSTAFSRNCPLCEANSETPVLSKNGLRMVRCDSCGMRYLNPAPADMAQGSFYDTSGANYYLSPDKLGSDYSPVRFQRELRILRRVCQAGSILDVGCSTGGFLFQLHRQFPGQYRAVGADVSGPALDHAESKGIKVIRGNFLEHDFGAEKFDTVTFWAVLEHLPDPAAFLRRAGQILKPDGVCIALVPNYHSLATRLLGSRYRYIYEQHLNYFDQGTLERMVLKFFPRVEIISSHFNPLVIWRDYRSGGSPVENSERAALLKKTNQYKQSPALLPLKLGYGLAESALARLRLADNLVAIARAAN